MSNIWKNYFYKQLILIICCLGFLGLFNYIIDPLGLFNHKYTPKYFLKVNEREQKSVQLLEKNYTSLIIGSSEFSYMNSKDKDLFNYSLSGLRLDEYVPYLSFFNKNNKSDLDRVYIGLDFEKTNLLSKEIQFTPSSIASRINDKYYFAKYLLSSSTVFYSLLTLEQNINKTEPLYDRKLFKYSFTALSGSRKIAEAKRAQRGMKVTFSDLNYQYNENYKKVIKKIKDTIKSKKIMVITPVWYSEYIDYVVKNKKIEYKQWITDIVDIFGEVKNCNIKNKLSLDYSNFLNYSHLHSKQSSILFENLVKNAKDENCMIVNKKSINKFYKYIDEYK